MPTPSPIFVPVERPGDISELNGNGDIVGEAVVGEFCPDGEGTTDALPVMLEEDVKEALVLLELELIELVLLELRTLETTSPVLSRNTPRPVEQH